MRFMDDIYATWGDLEKSLRSGAPAKTSETYLGDDEKQTRHFVYSMHDRAMAIGRALPDVVDLAGRRRMLDVGGNSGEFLLQVCRRNPELQGTVIDLPLVCDVTT